MSAGETPKKISISEIFFLCKAKVSSVEKITVVGKRSLEIHKLICIKLKSICLLNMLKVMLPPFAAPNVIIVCFATRELWTKQQNEIKQDFTNDGPFRVKPLAKEPGQMPEAKKSLSFGGANVNSVNNRSH